MALEAGDTAEERRRMHQRVDRINRLVAQMERELELSRHGR